MTLPGSISGEQESQSRRFPSCLQLWNSRTIAGVLLLLLLSSYPKKKKQHVENLKLKQKQRSQWVLKQHTGNFPLKVCLQVMGER